MRAQAGQNLGTTGLRHRRRATNPMQTFDTLPPELRRWIADAALPWSPASCRRLWQAARQSGASIEEALRRLDHAETAALTRAAG